MYVAIDEYNQSIMAENVEANTKYKTVDKKVKHVAILLFEDSCQRMNEVAQDPSLWDPRGIRHAFSKETREKFRAEKDDFLLLEEEVAFWEMLKRHGKAFAFHPNEIGCTNPRMIKPIMVFTIPHVSWNLKPIPVPRANIPKLIKLLKEKVEMGILEPSNAPYSNNWFTVPKKNGTLRFIQDLQPVNKVTIRNARIGLSINEFAEAFNTRTFETGNMSHFENCPSKNDTN